MTAPLINQAAVVAFLVAGGAKAGVLKEVLHGPRDPARLPAQLIQPHHGELLLAGGPGGRRLFNPGRQPGPGLNRGM